jgi:hypothetical protein
VPQPTPAALVGEYRIERTHRATGVREQSEWRPNTVLAPQHFVAVLGGASADGLTQASTLTLYNNSGGVIKTLDSCTEAPAIVPNAGAPYVSWKWKDDTTDSYTLNYVRTSTPGGVVFSEASPAFAGGNTKGATEIWTIEYRLSFPPPAEYYHDSAWPGFGATPLAYLLLDFARGQPAPAINGELIDDGSGDIEPSEGWPSLGNLGFGAPTVHPTIPGTLRWTAISQGGNHTGTWGRVNITGIDEPFYKGMTGLNWANKAADKRWMYHFDLAIGAA